jgi:hypothetical protein
MARLGGLARNTRLAPGRSSGRCGECGWGVSGKSSVWANRVARAHTRDTGHVTRTQSVKVTEYRPVPGEPG